MKHACLAIALAVAVAGCTSSTATTPTSNTDTVTFTAQLKPSNEAPNPISNAEQTASGNATITFVVFKDAAGNITSVTGSAAVTMQGFPAGSTITLAHIHTGAAGVAGPVLVAFVPPAGSVALVNGAGSFTQSGPVTGDQATNIINNPAGYYFNVHSAQNPGGVMRGQLVKQ
jgi:hypothetical protein